ncbi:MAG: DUF5906 domain-containing protein [Rhodospirillaceae bacterium]
MDGINIGAVDQMPPRDQTERRATSADAGPGAPATDMFAEFHRLGWNNLIPIIPRGAELSAGCTIAKADLGKIPGVRNDDGSWKGFEWTQAVDDARARDRWQGWGAGVAIRTGVPKSGLDGFGIVAIDADTTDAFVIDNLRSVLRELGMASMVERVGRPGRTMMFARTRDPVQYMRLEVERDDDADAGKIEILGWGKQVVLWGIHPTGKPYEWSAEIPHADTLPLWTAGQLTSVLTKLAERMSEMDGYTAKMGGGKRARAVGDGGEGEVDQASLRIPAGLGLDRLREVVLAVPNGKEVDRDEWTAVGQALRGATYLSDIDEADARQLWLDWSATWHGQDMAAVERFWDTVSVGDKRVGWDQLVWRAQKAGLCDFGDDIEQTITPTRVEDLPEDALRAYWGDYLVKRYRYIRGSDAYFDTETRKLVDRSQLNYSHGAIGRPSDTKNNAVAILHAHPACAVVERLTYRPGQGMEVLEREDEGHPPELTINTWVGTGAVPASNVSDDDVGMWLDLVNNIFPEPVMREHALDWLAFLLQKPGVKINHTLVIESKKNGIGKEVMLRPIFEVIGHRNIGSVSQESLEDNFHTWLIDKQVVEIEELHKFTASDVNRMKRFQASTGKGLAVNEKFRKTRKVPNIVNLIAYTNFESAVQIDEEDRRWAVSFTTNDKFTKNWYQEYAGEFDVPGTGWVGTGGREKVHGWLMQRDLSRFSPAAEPPVSGAKKRMMAASLSPDEHAIREMVTAGVAPFDVNLLVVSEAVNRLPRELARITTKRLGQVLERLGFPEVGRPRLSDGTRPILRAMRNAAKYQQMAGGAELRDAFLLQQKEAREQQETGFDS